jgi:ubiquinone/menaquinone biosynthesis C-methylase UbiE
MSTLIAEKTEKDEREAQFWDKWADQFTDDQLREVGLNETNAENLCRVKLLGDVKGKRVLDVGCGTGVWSAILANRGAEVWGIDISPACVRVTLRRAGLQGVEKQVHAEVMSAEEMTFEDGFFDVVHGQDIIHHLDAEKFGKEIARVLKPGGVAVFKENCANNPFLMFARNHICGRWGIPRWSSDDEYPLTKENRAKFGKSFQRMQVEYPVFGCFYLFDAKIFKYRNRAITAFCKGADSFVYNFLPFMRSWSYRQTIAFYK